MDPMSVTSAAIGASRAAWSVGTALHDFIESSKNVDSTVKALQAEVNGLGGMCDAVHTQLKSLPTPTEEDTQLLRGVNAQLTECERTMKIIDDSIDRVRQSKSSFFKQAIRQVRLNMKLAQIEESRKQTQAFTSNLQISLQLMSLKATYLAPKLANQALLEKLTALQISVSAQGQKLDQTLSQCAGRYISEATTLYAESIAGDSVIGEQTVGKRTAVSDWISSVDSAKVYPMTETPRSHTSSRSLHRDHDTGVASGQQQSARASSADEEDDDELGVELAAVSLDSAKQAFARSAFTETEPLLRQSLELLQYLPRDQRQHEYNEIQFMLAVCLYHKGPHANAEKALADIVGNQSQSDQEALRLCEAGVLLALTYVRLGKLGLARSTAESVLRSRRKLLSKSDDLYFDGLELLARIYGFQGNITRANTYRSMIPEDRRTTTYHRLDTLALSGAKTPATNDGHADQIKTEGETAGTVVEGRFTVNGRVRSLTCSHDNSTLACGLQQNNNFFLELRSIPSGCRTHLANSEDKIGAMAFTSCGTQLACVADPESRIPYVVIWRIERSQLTKLHILSVPSSHSSEITCLAWSLKDEVLVASQSEFGSPEKKAKLFGRPKSVIPPSSRLVFWSGRGPNKDTQYQQQWQEDMPLDYLSSLAVLPDSVAVVSDRYLKICFFEPRSPLRSIYAGYVKGAIAYSSMNDELAVLESTGIIHVLKGDAFVRAMEPGAPETPGRPTTYHRNCIGYRPDGRLVGICKGSPNVPFQNELWLCDFDKGTWYRLERHELDVYSTVMSPDAGLVVRADSSGRIRIWDVEKELKARLS